MTAVQDGSGSYGQKRPSRNYHMKIMKSKILWANFSSMDTNHLLKQQIRSASSASTPHLSSCDGAPSQVPWDFFFIRFSLAKTGYFDLPVFGLTITAHGCSTLAISFIVLFPAMFAVVRLYIFRFSSFLTLLDFKSSKVAWPYDTVWYNFFDLLFQINLLDLQRINGLIATKEFISNLDIVTIIESLGCSWC